MIPLAPRPISERRTFSVCPVCLSRIPARLVKNENAWHMVKECREHGPFSTVVWRETPERFAWVGLAPELSLEDVAHCPASCGLCAGHRQGTCCVLLEVTSRCNLSCRFCFAGAEENKDADPPASTVKEWIRDIARSGDVFLQLSGGEPTIRNDLPELVRFAKDAGCRYVQLNSNGLRLAEDKAYVLELARAGLSFVFMQFDGMDDAIYAALRGRPLLEQKLRAIANCAEHGIGVTLVPTVVPGVNDKDVGNIIRFAVEQAPAVRGVHLQPVSYFGRHPQKNGPVPDAMRITLPEVYSAVFAQAGDIVPPESIVPSRCDHPACGFHGGYIVTPQGLHALSPRQQAPCCPAAGTSANAANAAERNRHFVGSRWERPEPACCPQEQDEKNMHQCCDLNSLDGFLKRARSHAFTISAMAFQDAYTLDLERLGQCSLHVYDKGRIVPFCAKYIFQ